VQTTSTRAKRKHAVVAVDVLRGRERGNGGRRVPKHWGLSALCPLKAVALPVVLVVAVALGMCYVSLVVVVVVVVGLCDCCCVLWVAVTTLYITP
jgi:hypothetical protein